MQQSNQKKQSTQQEQSPKSIQESIGFLTKLNAYTLEHKLEISPDGEYLRFGNAKEALDVLKYIEKSMRNRGFGVYALHNCLWLVPFIHRDIHLADFKRAIKVLPDHTAELTDKLIDSTEPQPQDDGWHQGMRSTASFDWKKHKKWIFGGIAAVLFAYISL
tara:strand:- start:7283 stop:7765 length:483 start_codon:yes stop_codon:yes gene_type:complete